MGETIYHFSDANHSPKNSEVGGKGFSLIKMSKAGLAIPPGFVLAVDFFIPWIETLKKTNAWETYARSNFDPKNDIIFEIKSHCKKLSLNESQKDALEEALAMHPEIMQFAVRSSSPEEDLSGASFAGGYETVLGVTEETMEDAIRTAFASCLDPRVFIYKKEQGFKTDDFRIAVVVMEQVASEIAGVGFSVDPITNDYDLAVFSSNWGLGETVVAGLASPDLFTVNKVKSCIIGKQLGVKETSIWLLEDGGTEERGDPRQDEFTLDSEQVIALTHELIAIEKLYNCPMDIEWAYARERLFLLQARPITTFIPLSEKMITAPSDPRQLYLDITLSVQGLEKPLSAMGCDFMHHFISQLIRNVLGSDDIIDINKGALGILDGKIYLNLSNLFTLVSKETLVAKIQNMDSIASQIIQQLKPDAYIADKKLSVSKFKIALHMYDVALKVLTARFRIKAMAKRYEKDVEAMNKKVDAILSADEPLSLKINKVLKPFANFIVHRVLPPLIAGLLASTKIEKMFAEDAKKDPEVKAHLDNVSRSLPHNVTIEMGLDIYTLSTLLNKEDYSSKEALIKAYEEKALPIKFYDLWDKFIARFGARGVEEFNIASERYTDSPSMLLHQIYTMLDCDKENSPQTLYAASQAKRFDAYSFLLGLAEQKGKRCVKKFKTHYQLMEAFGGYRENHKFFTISLLGKVRTELLTQARLWVEEKKLDNIEQIFDLTLNDISLIEKDQMSDLDACIYKNTVMIRQLEKVKRPPPVIDSRGRVLHPERAALKENEIGGQAVSTGIVRGRVKVLHTPDEKPLLQNEILVARATDPGWTPLFVNAAAIVLEVGGMLQHGALVAREYGKPCVAGVEHATEVLKDGDYIEIDGTTGIIRRIDDPGRERDSATL